MKTHFANIALFFSALTIVPSLTFAQTDSVWDGTNNNWSDASHWSSLNSPNNGNAGQNYNATIDGGRVTLDQNVTVNRLEIGGFSKLVSSNGEKVQIDNHMLIAGQADLGDILDGNGLLVEVGNNGRLDFNLTASGGVINNATLRNFGIGSFDGREMIVNHDGALENFGRFDIVSDGMVFNRSSGSNSGRISNFGEFVKASGGDSVISVNYFNEGLTSVTGGTLSLTGAGEHSGVFNVASSGILNFSGDFNRAHEMIGGEIMGVGTSMVSTSVLRVDATSNYDISDTVLDQSFAQFDNAATTKRLSLIKTGSGFDSRVEGSGSLTVTEQFNFGETGSVRNRLVIGSAADLVLSNSISIDALTAGSPDITNAGRLINNGMATFLTGRFDIDGDSVFENNGEFVFENQDAAFSWAGTSGRGTFVNNGILSKSSFNGRTKFDADFENSGTARFSNNTVEFNGIVDQRAGVATLDNARLESSRQLNLNGGTIEMFGSRIVSSGATTINGGLLEANDSLIELSGDYTQNGGQFVLENSRVESSREMNVDGGSLEGFGRFNADINLNAGTLSPGFGEDDVAEIAIGGDLTMAESAIFGADIGGSNDGSQGSTSDYVGVEGDVFLDGILDMDLISGFGDTLQDGDWIQLLGSTSPDEMMILGEFNNVASGEFIIEDGYRFQVFYGEGSRYQDTSIVLEFSSVPEPSGILLIVSSAMGVMLVRRRSLA